MYPWNKISQFEQIVTINDKKCINSVNNRLFYSNKYIYIYLQKLKINIYIYLQKLKINIDYCVDK
jgi:hypothetical protein